ncbi:MAG TPA: helix-turn-helix domain-containing protein [Chloroflexota bacterium]
MQGLPDVYNLENIEQMRAISDELRQRIIRELRPEPHTVTQVADALGIAPARVHYHIRELERVGLVRMVHTREKGGILEKYYQPVARSLNIESELLQQAEPEEYIELTRHFLGEINRGFLNALSRAVASTAPELDLMTLGRDRIWVTPQEFEQVTQDIDALLAHFRQPRYADDVHQVSVTLITNKFGPVTEQDGDDESQSPARSAPKRRGSRKSGKTWAVGVFEWDRADLEAAVERGEALQITVLGVCRFADDVTPDLVDRAVSQFSSRGKLIASPEVREVLERKRTSSIPPQS